MKNIKKRTIVLEVYAEDPEAAVKALHNDMSEFLSDLQMGGGQLGEIDTWRVQVDGKWFSQMGIEDEDIW